MNFLWQNEKVRNKSSHDWTANQEQQKAGVCRNQEYE